MIQLCMNNKNGRSVLVLAAQVGCQNMFLGLFSENPWEKVFISVLKPIWAIT